MTSRRLLRRVLTATACYAAVLAALLLIGNVVTLPEAELALTPGGGALAAAAQVLTGKGGTADFLVDYSSAHALRSGISPYEISAVLNERVGTTWEVGHANPHPPTLLSLVLPFTVLPYEPALAAWSLAMVFALVATFRLVGVERMWALVAGVAVAIIWPGAYGIGNVVPVIGLGVTIAWRWRDVPAVAGAGVALAAIPKLSGLILVVPFLLTARWKAATWAVGFSMLMGLVPLLLDGGVWSAYLDSGVEAIRLNVARADNASLFNRGVPELVVTVILAAAAIAASRRTGDMYWPTVWLTVAALPIAWMYSLLTLAPLLARGLGRRPAGWLVVIGAAVAVGSNPLGEWPTVTFGVAVLFAFLTLWLTLETEGFPPPFWRRKRTPRHAEVSVQFD